MIRYCSRWILLFARVSLLAACGGGGGGASGGGSSGAAINVTGTWLSSCEASDSSYRTTGITFTNSELTQNNQLYTEETCSVANGIASGIGGPYTIGSQLTTSDGVTAYELDVTITVNNVSATLLDIIRVDGNTMYLSGNATIGARPNSLDFDKVYTRQ